LTTGFTGSAIGPGDLFLFNCTTVSGTIFLEVTGFEVSETAEFGQFNMLDFPNVAANGFIKVNDFGVRIGKGSEKLKDVFRVSL
jgi:hypothetical protein